MEEAGSRANADCNSWDMLKEYVVSASTAIFESGVIFLVCSQDRKDEENIN